MNLTFYLLYSYRQQLLPFWIFAAAKYPIGNTATKIVHFGKKTPPIAKKYTVFTHSKHGFIATLWQTDTYTISSILSKRVLRDILPYKEKELLPAGTIAFLQIFFTDVKNLAKNLFALIVNTSSPSFSSQRASVSVHILLLTWVCSLLKEVKSLRPINNAAAWFILLMSSLHG